MNAETTTIKLYAGRDVDGQVKLFTADADSGGRRVTPEEWEIIRQQLGMEVGEMPIVTLKAEPK